MFSSPTSYRHSHTKFPIEDVGKVEQASILALYPLIVLTYNATAFVDPRISGVQLCSDMLRFIFRKKVPLVKTMF